MYESFYGLREKPFSMLPDPGFLYLSKKHQMALTMLEYGLLNHAGFCVVSGETGSGKTTLLRKLLENIEPNITVGMITNTHKGFGEFLNWILSAFGIHEQDMSLVDMHQRFTDFVIEQYAANKTTLLIVDEAQNITAEKLEELRMLSNINSDQDQLLQVILAGQPELKDTLRLPELKQFAQRISVDYHLGALSEDETCGYIEHRLNVAGAERNLFTNEACKLIHEYSGGTPRLINLLCDTVLVYGFADQQEIIDESLVDEMVRERMTDSIVPINKEALSRKPVVRKKENKPKQQPIPKSEPEPELEPKPEALSVEKKKNIAESVVEDIKQHSAQINELPEKRSSEIPERRKEQTTERRRAEIKEQPVNEAKPVNDAIRQATQGYKKKVQPSEKPAHGSGAENKSGAIARVTAGDDVKLRGPNTIAIINPESLNKGWLSKWGTGIVIVAVLIVAGVFLSEGIDRAPEDKAAAPSNTGNRSEQKVMGDSPGEVPDKIKQKLDEAEKFTRELARKLQEDRERMDALEKQALELKKERDAAIAKAAAEEKQRSINAAALSAAKARERAAKAEADRVKTEAALIEAEKARLFMEVKKAEIEAREKQLQEQQAMMEKAKQEEAEAEARVQVQHEEEERAAATKKEEKRFRTDPCSSSTARFLSTCR